MFNTRSSRMMKNRQGCIDLIGLLGISSKFPFVDKNLKLTEFQVPLLQYQYSLEFSF